MAKIQCSKCGSIIEYNDKSVWEGNRDLEEVYCPKCNEYLTKVFIDGFPNPYIVKEGDTE